MRKGVTLHPQMRQRPTSATETVKTPGDEKKFKKKRLKNLVDSKIRRNFATLFRLCRKSRPGRPERKRTLKDLQYTEVVQEQRAAPRPGAETTGVADRGANQSFCQFL